VNVVDDYDDDTVTNANRRHRRRWTIEEWQQLSTAFGSCIRTKTMPSGKQITDLSKKLPGALLRKFVRRQIT